jgi:hypothetical protein
LGAANPAMTSYKFFVIRQVKGGVTDLSCLESVGW